MFADYKEEKTSVYVTMTSEETSNKNKKEKKKKKNTNLETKECLLKFRLFS